MPKNQRAQLVDTIQDPALARRFNPGYVEPQERVVQTDRKFNLAKDKTDNRDYLFTAVAPTSLSSVDMRQYCTTMEDQGRLGSCTGHAVTSAMEILLNKANKRIELSRLFVYYQARLLEGTASYDAGAYLRDAVKAANKWGASDERVWSYNIRLFNRPPAKAAYDDALKRRITEYRRCPTFVEVRASLAQGYPVVGGIIVYSSFLSAITTKTGTVPHPNKKKEAILGGHALCFVGYDDAREVFIVKNSWGISWGDNGYGYIPYSIVKDTTLAMDFWAIVGTT